MTIFGSNADVSGSIGRELTMAEGSLIVTDIARVGRNLTARVHRLRHVHIADNATIAGERDIQVAAVSSCASHRREPLRNYFVWRSVPVSSYLWGWAHSCTQSPPRAMEDHSSSAFKIRSQDNDRGAHDWFMFGSAVRRC